jgi:Myb-like DNA-binding domain
MREPRALSSDGASAPLSDLAYLRGTSSQRHRRQSPLAETNMSRHHPSGANKMALSNLLSAGVPGDNLPLALDATRTYDPDKVVYPQLSIQQLCAPQPQATSPCPEEEDAISSSDSDSALYSKRSADLSRKTPESPGGSSMCVLEARAKRPWTQAEDDLLRELVSRMGIGMWASIAHHIPDRSGKQVRERWLNHLSPFVTKSPWSPEEDRLILETHVQYGNAWSKIARLLKGRSDNSVKNRFYTTLKRRYLPPTTSRSTNMVGNFAGSDLMTSSSSQLPNKRPFLGEVQDGSCFKRHRPDFK